MKRAALAALLAILCAGCSDAKDAANAMTTFIKVCKGPVSAKMVLGNYGNTIELQCAELDGKITVAAK